MSIDWKKFSADYWNVINTTFSGLNLTSIKTLDELHLKQTIDSMAPVEQVLEFRTSLENAEIIIDLGTGGGFPLLPLAKLYPKKICLGIDARAKKLDAVLEIAKVLNLGNVRTLHSRFEDVVIDTTKTVVVVKAVGKARDVMDSIKHTIDLDFFFYKGKNFYNLEIDQTENLTNNDHLAKIYEVAVDQLDQRYIFHCQQKKNFSRDFLNKNKLITVSSLL